MSADILIVDDDPAFVATMERNFRPYKVELKRAYHGMQGIMNAVTNPPDLIITDLQMPLTSGEEMIDCISRNPVTHATPIIITTGRTSAKLTHRLRCLGVVAVLNKPFQFSELLQAISNVHPLEKK